MPLPGLLRLVQKSGGLRASCRGGVVHRTYCIVEAAPGAADGPGLGRRQRPVAVVFIDLPAGADDQERCGARIHASLVDARGGLELPGAEPDFQGVQRLLQADVGRALSFCSVAPPARRADAGANRRIVGGGLRARAAAGRRKCLRGARCAAAGRRRGYSTTILLVCHHRCRSPTRRCGRHRRFSMPTACACFNRWTMASWSRCQFLLAIGPPFRHGWMGSSSASKRGRVL